MKVRSIISNLPLTAFIISQASAVNIRIKSKIVDQWVALDFNGFITQPVFFSIGDKITNKWQSPALTLSSKELNLDKLTLSSSKQHSCAKFCPASRYSGGFQILSDLALIPMCNFEISDEALTDFMKGEAL